MYSTSSSVINDRYEPTEDQKTEFYRKAREDPELYSYNPLQAGNTWWYNVATLSNPAYTLKGRQITDSMVINDTMFYYIGIGGALSAQGFWLANRNDQTILWDTHQSPSFNDLDDNPETMFLVNEDFTVEFNDETNPVWVWTTYAPIKYQVIYVSSGWTEYYGVITQYKHYYYFPSVGDLFYEVVWVRGFGPVYFSHEEASYDMVACIIDGTIYGTPPSNIEEAENISLVPIQLSASPNPSKNGFAIKYQIGDKSIKAMLQIFNIRGQLLYQNEIRDSGTINWSNSGIEESRLSSGVYLITIKVNEINHKTLKITMY